MDCWIHIFIATSDVCEKCVPALERIWPELVPGVCVTVLSGEKPVAEVTLNRRFAGLQVHHHPGESVWHLRQRMGALLTGSQWMVFLEDHNLPLPGWLTSLVAELRHTQEEVDAVFGATCNQTSTGPWDWANYLAVQLFHWAPLTSPGVYPLPFNSAVRVARLPPLPWALGTLEQFMPALAQGGRMSAEFVVDHIQYRTFPDVLSYHFANGRASAANLRSHLRRPWRQLAGHLLHVLVVRPVQGWRLMRQHPQRHLLPSGTWWRWPLLLFAHASGAAVGFVAGSGRSMWLLE